MTKRVSECCGAEIVNVGGILELMGQIFNKNFDKQVDVFVCDSCSRVLKCECKTPAKIMKTKDDR